MAKEGYTDFTEKCTKWASSVNAGKLWQTHETHSKLCTCVVCGLGDAVMSLETHAVGEGGLPCGGSDV